MTSEQSRVLMGLDMNFELRGKAADSQRALGNGITFNVGRAISLAAQNKKIIFDVPPLAGGRSGSGSDDGSGGSTSVGGGDGSADAVEGDTIEACLADMDRVVKRMRKLSGCPMDNL
jgi:hypothetical protein